jgi:hypothetical protein
MARSRIGGGRAIAAAVRAGLVGAAALAPSLVLDAGTAAGAVIAAAAALAVLFEYGARTPALLDFRFAPPVNRLRFAVVCAVLASVTLAVAQREAGGGGLGALAAALTDFPFSPARMAADAFTRPSAPQPDAAVQAAAGVAMIVGGLGAALGAAWIWRGPWPGPPGRFDAMTNLPTFEPAVGPDAARRLSRLGGLVILTALAAPLALLVLARFAVAIMDPELFQAPLALVWSATIWAALPATLLLRGVAILKLARRFAEGGAEDDP